MVCDPDIADSLPLVTGAQAALRRVFQSLLANAIKYGAAARTSAAREPRERRGAFGVPASERAGASGGAKPPGREGIGIRALVAGGRLEVSVPDPGIGIPAAEQAKILHPFYPAPDAAAGPIRG